MALTSWVLATFSCFVLVYVGLGINAVFDVASMFRDNGHISEGAFHSVSSKPQNALISLSFGSCNKHDRPQQYWGRIHDTLAHFLPYKNDQVGGFIWLGDVVYGDTTYGPGIWVPSSMETMRNKYTTQLANPHYDKFVKSVQFMDGVWDDHDMGLNDGGKEYKDKDLTQQLFLDFFAVQDEERRQRKGVYSFHKIPFPDPSDRQVALSAEAEQMMSQYQSAVCLILLDVRYYRDPITEERVGDVLGEPQWKWLEQTLKAEIQDEVGEVRRKCALTLLGSGIQFLSDEKPAEHWGHFPAARDRLLNLLQDIRINRAIFISGDVHLAEIFKESSGIATQVCQNGTAFYSLGYPVIDVTSSGLTHSNGEILPTPLFDYLLPASRRKGRFLSRNYGTVTLRAEHDDLFADFLIHDVWTGQPVIRLKQPLSELHMPDKCRKLYAGQRRHLNDGEHPPFKAWLLWVQFTFFPQLKIHHILFLLIFSIVITGCGLLVAAVLILKSLFGRQKKEKIE